MDATLGTGGHSNEILKYLDDSGRLIGIDCDEQAIVLAKERLAPYGDRVKIIYDNYTDLENILTKEKISGIDGILFDLGVSSFQLSSFGRGFSFQSDEKLDMRMDCKRTITAEFIINKYTEEQLSDIFFNYGEERNARRIAKKIVESRRIKPIQTTKELSELIYKPGDFRGKIHPATKIFQALRIFINNELDNIKKVLPIAINRLNRGGRILAISFHSMEDRIVKHTFVEAKSNGLIRILTGKPIVPTDEEIKNNPRARSALLRVAEKI